MVKPIGEVLLQTGLVSAQQVQEALRTQTQNSTLRLGEILAHHGWIKQETANFFAEIWPHYLNQRKKQPIGQYLRDASLLDSQQVQSILDEQTQTGTRFGELIVRKGWLNQETIDFFIHAFDPDFESKDYQAVSISDFNDSHLQAIQDQLLENQTCDPYQLLLTYQKALLQAIPKVSDNPEQAELLRLGLLVEENHRLLAVNPRYRSQFDTSWVDQALGELRPFEKVRIHLFKLEERASLPFAAIEEVFSWTGREPFLTQSVCQAIYESGDFIPADEEKAKVAHVVQTHILQDWENKVAAKHFQEIIYQIQAYPDTLALLTRYQQVLRQENNVTSYDPEQEALTKLGLVTQEQGQLSVANRIYASVFNDQWVTEEIAKQARRAPKSSVLFVEPSHSRPRAQGSLVKGQSGLNREKTGRESNWGRWVIGLLLLGCIGTLAAIFARRIVQTQTATRYFDQGNALFSQGQHEEAIAKYNEVLDVDGNYHQAWTNRGYALAGLGDYTQMLSSCRSATIIDPQAVYAWNCQGEALHNLKQFEEAIAAYDKAIALDPADPVFWINKSESLLASENFEQALNASQTAIERLEILEAEQTGSESVMSELAIAWSTRGRVLQKTEQYSNALEAYEKSLAYNPAYFSALLGKGITLKRLEQYQAADAQFKLALEQPLTENQQAEIWFYSGLTHCKLGQPEKAMDAYNNALNLKPDFEAVEMAKQQFCY